MKAYVINSNPSSLSVFLGRNLEDISVIFLYKFRIQGRYRVEAILWFLPEFLGSHLTPSESLRVKPIVPDVYELFRELMCSYGNTVVQPWFRTPLVQSTVWGFRQDGV